MSIKVTVSVSDLLSNPKVLEALSSAPKISDAEIYSNVLFAGIQSNDPLASITTNTPTLFDVVLDYKVKVERDFDFTKISLLIDHFATKQKKSARELLRVKELLEPIFVVLNKENKVRTKQTVLPAKAKQNLNFVNLAIGDIEFERKRRLKENKVSLSSLTPETVLDKDFRRIVRTKIKVSTKQKKTALDSFSVRDTPISAKGFINKNSAKTFDKFRTFQKTKLSLTASLLSDIFQTKVTSRPKFVTAASLSSFVIRPAKSNISFDSVKMQQSVIVARTVRRQFRNVVKLLSAAPIKKTNKSINNIIDTFIFTKPAKSSIRLNKVRFQDEGVRTKQSKRIPSELFNIKIDQRFFKPSKVLLNKVKLSQQVLRPKSLLTKDFLKLTQEEIKKVTTVNKDTVSLQQNFIFKPNKNLLSKINFSKLVVTSKPVLKKNTISFSSIPSKKTARAVLNTASLLDILEVFPEKNFFNKLNLKQAVLRPKHTNLKEFVQLEDILTSEHRFKIKPNVVGFDENLEIRFVSVKKPLQNKLNLVQKLIQAKSLLPTDSIEESKDILKSKVSKPVSSDFKMGFEIVLFKKIIRLPTIFNDAAVSQSVLRPKSRLLLNKIKFNNFANFGTTTGIQNKITIKNILRKFLKKETPTVVASLKSNLVQASKSQLLKDNLNFRLGTVLSSKFLEAKKETVESSFVVKRVVFRGPTNQKVKSFQQVLPRKAVIQFNSAEAISEVQPRHIVKGVLKTLDTSDKLRKAHVRTKYFDNFSSSQRVVYRGKANILKNSFTISERKDRIDTIKRLISILNLQFFISKNTNRKVEEKATAPDKGSAFYTNQGYVSGPYFLEPYVGGATTASHF
jgi:hypothetical protein